MDENQERKNLIDTTDCLEAVGVFRGWKNFLFVITILFLLLTQLSFWLVDTGLVKIEDTRGTISAIVATEAEEIDQAAKQVATEPNQPAQIETRKEKHTLGFHEIKFYSGKGLLNSLFKSQKYVKNMIISRFLRNIEWVNCPKFYTINFFNFRFTMVTFTLFCQ